MLPDNGTFDTKALTQSTGADDTKEAQRRHSAGIPTHEKRTPGATLAETTEACGAGPAGLAGSPLGTRWSPEGRHEAEEPRRIQRSIA